MGKCLWKSNPSAKDLVAIQTYLKEYCNSIYYKLWRNQSDYKSQSNSALCQVASSSINKGDLRLPELLRDAKSWKVPFIEIESAVDMNIGTMTVAKIENGVVKYYFPFIDYARAYMDIRKMRG